MIETSSPDLPILFEVHGMVPSCTHILYSSKIATVGIDDPDGIGTLGGGSISDLAVVIPPNCPDGAIPHQKTTCPNPALSLTTPLNGVPSSFLICSSSERPVAFQLVSPYRTRFCQVVTIVIGCFNQFDIFEDRSVGKFDC